ncbi:unnamed protein product, partial [Meganyctiphanes norvegica]
MSEVVYNVNIKQFWGAIKIYTDKSHILNRRICGTINLWCGIATEKYQYTEVLKQVQSILKNSNGADTCLNYENNLPKAVKENIEISNGADQHTLTELLVASGYQSSETLALSTKPEEDSDTTFKEAISIPWWQLLESECQGLVVIRKTMPRNLKQFAPLLEVVIIAGSSASVNYIGEAPDIGPSVHPRVCYSFSHSDENIHLSILSGKKERDIEDPNIEWLRKNVLPKICKWAAAVSEDGEVEDRSSLRLVNVQDYTRLYQQLKIKYGQPLVQVRLSCTRSNRSCLKDSYEILIWKTEIGILRQKKSTSEYQSFVDLGCGNGLLVYILSSEGHPGLGIDLKRRKIWDLFPSNVKLQEGIIEPSDQSLFPDYNWLIGNHSDELTPWLPVIAAKSSHNTRFFVLPCCPHDFDCKYRRSRPGMSIYSEYLDYVREVGSICGYDMWQDRLRIPSTKRVCFVGQERIVKAEDFPQLHERIDVFVKKRTMANSAALKRINGNADNCDGENGNQGQNKELWSSHFKARSSVEAVRNCSQLDKTVREDLLTAIANILLGKRRIVELSICGKTVNWDRGGSVSMGDLAKRLSAQQLAALKAQCGGLQTLIKNHKHIFALEKGTINLQIPRRLSDSKVPSDRLRTKPCWFHQYHPQGCPLPQPDCLFSH